MIKKQFSTESDMLLFAAAIAQMIDKGTVIFLHGPLGAGKTTFTRGFLRGLGYMEKVKSPTYTLVEPYELTDKTIFHFDLYRLNSPKELEQIGLSDYFSPAAICLVEWPEKGKPLLPVADFSCYIDFIDEGREISLIAHTARGEKILAQLS